MDAAQGDDWDWKIAAARAIRDRSASYAESGKSRSDCHVQSAMTGIELQKHLIENGHAIPTLLVTAYPDDDARARALKAGIISYLRKPVDEERLKRCLRAALNS